MFEPQLNVALRQVVRRAADLVDVQWALLMNFLKRGAPRARGRLLVAPPMLGFSGAAKVLARVFDDSEETLGFSIVARRSRRAFAKASP